MGKEFVGRKQADYQLDLSAIEMKHHTPSCHHKDDSDTLPSDKPVKVCLCPEVKDKESCTCHCHMTSQHPCISTTCLHLLWCDCGTHPSDQVKPRLGTCDMCKPFMCSPLRHPFPQNAQRTGDAGRVKSKFFEELEFYIDEYFPKGECKERGAALVVFAWANQIHNKMVEELLTKK